MPSNPALIVRWDPGMHYEEKTRKGKRRGRGGRVRGVRTKTAWGLGKKWYGG